MMKKGLLFVFLLTGLFVAGIYLFIPSQVEVSGSQLVRSNGSAVFRRMSDRAAWTEWWPRASGDHRGGGGLYPNVGIGFGSGADTLTGVLSVLTVGTQDSTELLFRGRLEAGATPWSRFSTYRRSLRMERQLRVILAAAGDYVGKSEHLYGMPIRLKMSKDSTIIVTKMETTSYPTTEEIYRVIGGLRTYIASQGAREINQPMLHVRADSGRFFSMIAIPTDRELKGTKAIIPERFVPWKILEGEVRGGPAVAEEALRELHLYVADHQYTEMAMAFQLLVTERDKEADTLKWVTRVITPVP